MDISSLKSRRLLSAFFKKRLRVHFIPSRETEVVIFDKTNASEIQDLCGGRKTLVFDPRYESELFAWPFIRAFFEKLFRRGDQTLTTRYFIHLLGICKPSIAVTGTHLSSVFYEARKRIDPLVVGRFVVFQTTLWADTGMHMLTPVGSKNLHSQDLIFCITDGHVQAWSALSSAAKIIPIGTLSAIKNKDVLSSQPKTSRSIWVSVWRNSKTVASETSSDPKRAYELEIEYLPRLEETLSRLGLDLYILGSRKAFDGQEEYDFYRALLGDRLRFIHRTQGDNVYNIIGDSLLLFGAGSTLLYEALWAGKKVMFLDNGQISRLRHPLGFPHQQAFTNSPLHLLGSEVESWGRKVNELLRIAPREFNKLVDQTAGCHARKGSFALIEDELWDAQENKAVLESHGLSSGNDRCEEETMLGL